AIGGEHPALSHLDYERYNSPGRQLTKSILSKGAAEAIRDYREQRDKTGVRISEQQMNSVGYLLIRRKKLDDAIVVFVQNTEDFPASWNGWDSLAEAYMDQGNKELAI